MLRLCWTLCVAAAALLTLGGCPQFSDGRDDGPGNTTAPPPGSNPDMGDDMPPAETRACAAEVTFTGGQGAQRVVIAGEFNDWDEDANPLTRDGNVWRGEVELPPGQYAYKFVVDGVYEGQVPPDVFTKWSGDFENRALIVDNCYAPAWRVMSSGVSASGEVSATLRFVPSVTGELVDPQSVRVTVGDVQVTPQVNAETGEVTVRYQAPKFGKYSIRATASDAAGRVIPGGPLWLPLWHEAQPFTWQDATMYLIFTDRFLDSDGTSPLPPIEGVQPIAGFMGGDFKGIIDKIEEGYFEQMGVNLLWLSPIYKNTDRSWAGAQPDSRFTGYHGYWPVESLKAETRYGDAEADADARLKELIDKAHERGIRVLFDVVHNHVHEEHVWCQRDPSWCARTCTCGSDGCGWDDVPLTCQFAPYLPDLSYRNHEILQRQVADTVRLGELFDIDGYRVDAAKHMDHAIMRTLRLRLNAMEAYGATPFYMVGETYTGGDGYGLIMDYVADHELHGQFDFPLLYPIRAVFGGGASFNELEAAVVRSEQAYGEFLPWMSPFLGNHDIPRFVTQMLGNGAGVWGGTPDVMAQGPAQTIEDPQWFIINRMALGYAFLLTQQGVPLMYYGDEVGLAGDGDPDNRRMMLWDWNAAQRELFARVSQLGQARRDLAPLRRGGRTQLWVDDSLYVYARSSGPGQTVIVALNKGEGARTEAVTIPAALGVEGRTLTSYNSDRTLSVSGGAATLTLNPWEYAIFHVSN